MSNTFSLLLPFCGLFSVPSAESRLNCGVSTFRTCPRGNMAYYSPARKFVHARSFLTLQGESYQPESKTQQPPQRRSEFPPRPQAGRQQHKTGRQRQPSRTAPACREWHRPGTPGRTVRWPGRRQNRRRTTPRRRAQPAAPAGRRGPPHQGQEAFQQIGPQGRKLRKRN